MRKTKAGIFTLSSTSLIICECLFNIVIMFLDVFLVSKLLKLTPGNYSNIAIFNFIYYIVIALCYFGFGGIVKRINKSILLGVGTFILAGLFICVFLLGDNIVNFIWTLGAVSGLGYGIFISGFDNLVSDIISSKNQTIYFSVKNILIFLTKTVFPLVLGSIIDLGSFPLMCVIIAVICILISGFSILIKNKKTQKSYNIFKFIKILKEKKEETKPLKTLYLSAIFRGFCFDIIATVFTILLFLSSGGSDFKIGLFQTIFTATQLISTFIFMRFYHKKRSGLFIFASLGIIIAASIPVFFIQNITTVLIMFGVYTFFRLFITTITDMRKNSTIRLLSMHSHSIEHNALYSLIYGVSRASSYLLLLLFMVVPEGIMLNIVFGVNLASYVGYGITLHFLEKQLIQQDINWKKAHPDEMTKKEETKITINAGEEEKVKDFDQKTVA